MARSVLQSCVEVFAYVGLPQNLKDLKEAKMLSPDTCLDLTMLAATDPSSLRWLFPFHLWYPTDLTHPPTQSLTLYLVGYPWLELLHFSYGIP